MAGEVSDFFFCDNMTPSFTLNYFVNGPIFLLETCICVGNLHFFFSKIILYNNVIIFEVMNSSLICEEQGATTTIYLFSLMPVTTVTTMAFLRKFFRNESTPKIRREERGSKTLLPSRGKEQMKYYLA